ncbi:MAG TPA: hypothetical protein PK460_01795 [Bacilli bacterium]|nr:hypothetical protein [Bacilli bacterium]
MNKYEDKLKKIKKDIPEYPKTLDPKVLEAAHKAPRSKRPGFPKLLIPSLLTVTAIALSTFFVTKYVYYWNNPVNSSSDTSDPTDKSSEPTNRDFAVMKSLSIDGTSLDPDVIGEGRYGYMDIIFVDSHNSLNMTITKYAEEAQPTLNDLTFEIKDNDDFFDDNVLLIVPFAHTSSETEISLEGLDIAGNNEPTKIHFDIFSPEFNDMDVLVQFNVVVIGTWASESLNKGLFEIIVHNTLDNSNKSVFYGHNSITNDNSETPSEKENEESIQQSFIVKKSLSIDGTSLAPDVTTEGRYGYMDIVFVDSLTTLNATITKYAEEAQPTLSDLTFDIKDDDDFFIDNVLLIVPFAHTSTEIDISLQNVYLSENEEKTKLHFDVYSPEFNDMDVLVQFHIVTIEKDYEVFLNNSKFKIIVNNTFDNSNKSVFYRD